MEWRDKSRLVLPRPRVVVRHQIDVSAGLRNRGELDVLERPASGGSVKAENITPFHLIELRTELRHQRSEVCRICSGRVFPIDLDAVKEAGRIGNRRTG